MPLEIAQAATLAGFHEVAVDARSAAGVAELPLHHRDPFDRLLIAQALVLPTRFLTADATLTRYSDLVVVA